MIIKTKKEAKEMAEYFKKQLKDLGAWKIVIGKNIEYFVYATNGQMSLSIDTDSCNKYYYNVYFSKEAIPLSSEYEMTVERSFKSPKEAIIAQKDLVDLTINKYTN